MIFHRKKNKFRPRKRSSIYVNIRDRESELMNEILELKKKICRCIDENRDAIIKLGNEIYANPETGYKEKNTSADCLKKIKTLVPEIRPADGIPGFKATLDTGKKGPGTALLAELDSVICAGHPHSNKKTGAVHACGHNMQMAAVFGAALALKNTDAAKHLVGKVHFMYVPAEEYIETEYRMDLRDKGIISYLGGKPEFMKRGFFDDVDISLMFHARPGNKQVYKSSTFNGCIVKKIKYIGKPAHAGGAPDQGVNALYAANIGLTALNSHRETFREDQFIRIHPIITKGGEIVNVIPSDVRLETFVRGKSAADIAEAAERADSAFAAGAIALGAKLQIQDLAGYFPVVTDPNLMDIAEKEINTFCKEDQIGLVEHSTGSTDLGDVSSVMPAIHPYIGGVSGGLHSANFRIVDEETAYILNAKLYACITVELLREDLVRADTVIRNHNPYFPSIKEYCRYTDKIFRIKRLNELYLFQMDIPGET
jgi:amidohydrolase